MSNDDLRRTLAEVVRAVELLTEAVRIDGRRTGAVVDEIAEIKATIAVRLSATERETKRGIARVKLLLVKASPWLVGGVLGWLARHLGHTP